VRCTAGIFIGDGRGVGLRAIARESMMTAGRDAVFPGSCPGTIASKRVTGLALPIADVLDGLV
jgi:hypothetical protein